MDFLMNYLRGLNSALKKVRDRTVMDRGLASC